MGLTEDQIRPYLNMGHPRAEHFGLIVACINSPTNVTVSGEISQLIQLQKDLEQEGRFVRLLAVSIAYHSPQMLQIAEQFRESVGKLQVPEQVEDVVPMVSSVTGELVENFELTQDSYWAQNLTSPVLFSQALERLCRTTPKRVSKKLDYSHIREPAIDMLVEIGPHSTLKSPIQSTLKKLGRENIHYQSALIRNTSATLTFLNLMGSLHCMGHGVDLRRVNSLGSVSSPSECTALVDLPQYPFNHSQRYWWESRLSKDYRLRRHGPVDLLGVPSTDWNPMQPKWRNFIKISELPWVEDHQVRNLEELSGIERLLIAIDQWSPIVACLRDDNDGSRCCNPDCQPVKAH